MAVSLTLSAISTLLSGRYTSMFKPVVQVIGLKCTSTHTKVNTNGLEKSAYYRIVISDGSVSNDVTSGYKIDEMIRSKQLQKGSIVQLTDFSSGTSALGSHISVDDLNVLHWNGIILGDPKPITGNKFPSVRKFIPTKLNEEPVDPEMYDNRHHADEHTTSKHKCCSCQTQSRKRQRQSSDYKEDDDIGACFEKLRRLGCGEGPMYDTAVLLFGESSDYRKIWLHLNPKSCANWVKNAGSKYGLLG